jgi:ribosomal protein L11 methyltransferase
MNDEIRSWHAIDVTVDSSAVEAVEYAFNLLGSIGTEVNEMRKSADGTLCVTGYFNEPPQMAAVEGLLEEAIRTYGLPPDAVVSAAPRIVTEQDWLAEWKRHWHPTEVGRFVIAPPWADVPQTDKLVIRIEPNMAFGTGTHETTQLCLEAIGGNFLDGMSFLDVGTGTGILALAAAKLSSTSPISACDTDADSIRIALENAAANHVGDRVQFLEGSVESVSTPHTFVCANLTLDVITRLLPKLIANTSEILLLSGILIEQQEAIKREVLKFQISNLKFTYSGEWISVLIHK